MGGRLLDGPEVVTELVRLGLAPARLVDPREGRLRPDVVAVAQGVRVVIGGVERPNSAVRPVLDEDEVGLVRVVVALDRQLLDEGVQVGQGTIRQFHRGDLHPTVVARSLGDEARHPSTVRPGDVGREVVLQLGEADMVLERGPDLGESTLPRCVAVEHLDPSRVVGAVTDQLQRVLGPLTGERHASRPRGGDLQQLATIGSIHEVAAIIDVDAGEATDVHLEVPATGVLGDSVCDPDRADHGKEGGDSDTGAAGDDP